MADGGDVGLHVGIVGGGLVGSLNACMLARRGFRVTLFEQRQDIRKTEHVKGRSINLALSHRGREALRLVGLETAVVSIGIPMRGRMIHSVDGSQKPIPYGTAEQYIVSVDRRKLNEDLLVAAEKHPNVTLVFSHKLESCDFNSGKLEFKRLNGEKSSHQVDLIVGNDGAFSAVRRQMMKSIHLNYSQEYIPHGYMELTIPPTDNGMYQMPLNFLHIWPRNEFMMIALPNPGGSFTLTLFMPFEMFDEIKSDEDAMNFFQDKFPDSISLIGKDKLEATFRSSNALPMVSIKCFPHHIGDRAVIMGDAAHAMVPFYGQGMNCGFEDCIILDELMEKYNNDLKRVLPEYTRLRQPDAEAICDLAMYNYVEMRKSVNSRLFFIRKKCDNALHWLMPSTWIPLYSMVAFTRISYRQCILKRKWQDKVITAVSLVTMASLAAGVWFLIKKSMFGEFIDLVSESLKSAVIF